MQKYEVIIVGAGLSGMSCAVNLVSQQQKVLVLEAGKVLGGRTSSWNEGGMLVESGLHRFLGFFEHLPSLIETVGVRVDDIIHWEDEIEIRLADGDPSAVFALAPLFRPLQSVANILGNNDFISPEEKIKLAAFFTGGFAAWKADPRKLDTFTVYEYAKEYDVSDETIERVLIPLTEGLFFLSYKKYSALHLFALFAPYLAKSLKTRVGAFKGGMTEVMITPMASYVREHGSELRTNAPVTEFLLEDAAVRGVMVNGAEIESQQVVLATNLGQAQKLLRKQFSSYLDFQPLFSQPTMPSATFQLELSYPSMAIDRTTFSPGTIFSAYAEQSRTTFPHAQGRLSIILAEPEKWLVEQDEKVLDKILEDAHRLGLHLTKDTIQYFRRVNWPEEFYSYERDTYWSRPEQKTAILGLTLAGDYTKQEFLQTMEGAVYSGNLAADVILQGR